MSRPAAHIASLVGAVASLVAVPAAAEGNVPGTGGDTIREIESDPAFVDTELPVLALRGGTPADTVVLFDGFEVPWIFHPDGVRSVVPAGSLRELEFQLGGAEAELGHAASVLQLRSGYRDPGVFTLLTPLDVTLHSGQPRLSTTVRIGWNRALRGLRANDDDRDYDGIGRVQWRLTDHWTLALSAMSANGDDRSFTRGVLAMQYTTRAWRAVLAASVLAQDGIDASRMSYDTRAELIRTVTRAAGLANIEWRIGQQTNSSDWDVGDRTLWRHDIALWSSIAAKLSPAIQAIVGLRVDDFAGDIAVQPRATLIGFVRSDLSVSLAAGAYRRPAELPAELGRDLNPERATQIDLATGFTPTRGLGLVARTYYIDRTRLVAPDQLGVLHNTGVGTSRGVELIARGTRGAWSGRVGLAFTHSTRIDYPRAAEHPAPFEQPFRLDALASWKRGGLVLSARLRLASGLPYTPYPGAVYDSDTDTYEPLYVPALSARTPFHHQVDLRADYRTRLGNVYLDAFLDLHDVYRNEDAIGYAYSFDYSTRTAITALPLFPFAGLRLTL